MMKPTLLIMAAGMGSRFGGLKQIEPVGPGGEVIIDYSMYDAIRAGFGKVVFVIRESFANEFKEMFAHKLEGKIETAYVFQELDNLPDGFKLPKARDKPWGTGHAILIAQDVIKEPFCALNADDFYGYNAFKTMAAFLATSTDLYTYAMVGYKLRNTLSDYGTVSRGVCEVDENNKLRKIKEVFKILKRDNRIISMESDGSETEMHGNESVSMNMWGFKPTMFDVLEKKFTAFLNKYIDEPKSEFFIPNVVFDMIKTGHASVKVLTSDSPWFGVTYREDIPFVVEKVKILTEAGFYPEKLF